MVGGRNGNGGASERGEEGEEGGRGDEHNKAQLIDTTGGKRRDEPMLACP